MSVLAPPAGGLRLLEIDVYTIDLHVPSRVLRVRESLLSPEERERAGLFRFERDRDRFIACRGAVRTIIAERVHAHPSFLSFQYGPHGKPELAGPNAGSISFNVSHSEGLALCALSAKGELGVDVERVRDLPDLDSVAAKFFSSRECAFLRDASPGAQVERFFQLWTRKEAWLKARGDGLLGPLTEIEVHGATPELGGWALQSFVPVPGFVAAVATCTPSRVAIHRWNG